MNRERSPSGTRASAGIDRRELLLGSAAGALVLGSSAFFTSRAAFADSVEVATTGGRVRGLVESGVNVFRGIPYGSTTAGARRFLAPRPPAAWSGVLEAFRYGPSSPQPSRAGGSSSRPSPLAHLFSPAEPPSPAQTPEDADEDCLRLNVWTRGSGPGDGARRPVMVWLHGGGFTTGSGSSLLYDGVNLANRGDVVLVTVNHRLGALGYLHLGDLLGGEYTESGNAGMLDIVLALEWVRNNIERFGGDPSRVTIFGESGGGRKVTTLLAMPSARGLFHRAIIQSGPGIHMEPKDHAHQMTLALLDELEITSRDPLPALQRVPVERLLAAQVAVSARQDSDSREKGVYSQRGFGPTVDGEVLPTYAFDPVATEVSAHVPLLIGTNTHELALFIQGDDKIWNRSLTESELESRVELMAGDAKRRVLEVYRNEYPDASPTERYILMLTDRTYRFDSMVLAQRKCEQPAPVFMYLFAWQTPTLDGRLHAPHALEIPFVFDNVAHFPHVAEGRSDAAVLAGRASQAWMAFAATGDPGHADLPDWPRYDSQKRRTMVLDSECRVAEDPGQAVRRLWATV